MKSQCLIKSKMKHYFFDNQDSKCTILCHNVVLYLLFQSEDFIKIYSDNNFITGEVTSIYNSDIATVLIYSSCRTTVHIWTNKRILAKRLIRICDKQTRLNCKMGTNQSSSVGGRDRYRQGSGEDGPIIGIQPAEFLGYSEDVPQRGPKVSHKNMFINFIYNHTKTI